MTEVELEDAVRSLRRTAVHTRASRQHRWLETAMELEQIADQRERELLELRQSS